MPFLLALDQGTTSSRAIVFDSSGDVVATAQREFEQLFPRPGWVEHDPREIWSSQLAVTEEVLAAPGLDAGDVAGIGITNQRETVVVWERRTGDPIHNAIVWQDRRTAGACDRLRDAGLEPVIRERTGLRLDPYFSAAKIAWILDHVDGARARAEAGELAAGTIDSWLLWNLTEGGIHVTEESNAARTSLYDIHSRQWDPGLLELFDVPAALLPEVRTSSEVYGEALVGARGVPLSGMAGDQQAALFGQACFDSGQAKNTYGTGCFLLQNTGQRVAASEHGLLSTVAWRVGDRTTYALEGSVFSAGSVVQWLRDGLRLFDDTGEVEVLAGSVADSGGVYFVPAFTGLGAPHWDPHARGLLIGLTRGTTRAHVARAALEAIAYQVADVADAMRADTGIEIPALRVDGGAAANDLLLQFQADLLGCPVHRPGVTETTAWGAACLAGLGVGVWSDPESIQAAHEWERSFEPRRPPEEVAALRNRWSEAARRSRAWVDHSYPAPDS